MAELTAENLAVGYDGKAVAENINFKIERGDYLYIVGENGAGKSTLMKTILGLIKPIRGSVEFGAEQKQNRIGYIPQQTEAQKDFPASVYELFKINELARRQFGELSGGQKQRVLLARAMCAAKSVLLLDEPVAGLDPIVTSDLYETIKQLNDEQKMTVIMISHDIKAAVKYASHVLFVGKPCFFGRKSDFLNSEFCKKSENAEI